MKEGIDYHPSEELKGSSRAEAVQINEYRISSHRVLLFSSLCSSAVSFTLFFFNFSLV